jgi:hypothetical protein
MKQLANFLSYLFHPAFMPAIGMWIVLNYGLYVNLPGAYKWFVCIATFIFTCVLPVLSIYILRSMKMVSSMHLPTREERWLPLFAAAVFFCMAYMLIDAAQVIALLSDIMMAGVATTIVIFIFNFAYKLSIHMAAIGSLTAMLTVLSLFPGTRLLYFLTAAIAVSGLIGFARLELKAHSTGEVIVGYLTGFVSQYLVLRLLVL